MKPKRIIIHTENMELGSHDFWRVKEGIRQFYDIKPQGNTDRLTVRFDVSGEMIIYNDPKDIHDVVIFTTKTSGGNRE